MPNNIYIYKIGEFIKVMEFEIYKIIQFGKLFTIKLLNFQSTIFFSHMDSFNLIYTTYIFA